MSVRRCITGIALILVAAILVGQVRLLLHDPTIWPPDDFVEYWAAARLTLMGEDPYNANRLLPLEQLAGRSTDEAVMMWNPPYTLAIVLPLGLLPPREAQLLWLLINLAAMGYSADRLWDLLGGQRSTRWQGWLMVFAALPTAFALQSGQISPLLLLGAVLFLQAIRRGWDFAAGAATVLLAIKPHLAYLVWAAIVLQAVLTARFRLILGAAAAALLGTSVVLLRNPEVLTNYFEAMSHRPPAQWISPTLGTLLRFACGEKLFFLQFIPMLLGFLWWAGDRWLRDSRDDRDWSKDLPKLLLISFVTAPYGAWPFDMVLLLPAVLQMFIRADSRARLYLMIGFVAIDSACLLLNLLRITSFWFLWVSPAILVLWILCQRRQHGSRGFRVLSPIPRSSALVSS